MRRIRRQSGMALLAVLLLVAVASVLAAGIVQRQYLDIRRAGNQVYIDQARQYAWAAESWALALLDEDAQNNRTDSQHDDWATVMQGLPIEGGTLSGSIQDMQGRLNLNNLLDVESNQLLARERLARLLEAQALDPLVLDALIDWMDKDSQLTGTMGAEDDYYSRLKPGYRAANQALVHSSEMRNVRGMGEGYFEKLAALVTALPPKAGININTASPEVLQALGLTGNQVDAVVKRREQAAFSSVNQMFKLPELQGMDLNGFRLGVRSRYFLLKVEVQLDRVRYLQSSLIERRGIGDVKVLWRRRGEA